MKKVFEAEMDVTFSDKIDSNIRSMEISSADKVEGIVNVEVLANHDNRTLRLKVEILTKNKNKLASFESYLNVIRNTLSHSHNLSVESLRDIQTNMSRYEGESEEVVKNNLEYRIVKDEDGDYLIVNSWTNIVIGCYKSEADATYALVND